MRSENRSTSQVIEDVPAGKVATKTVGPGQAIRIMTGAPIPQGADCRREGRRDGAVGRIPFEDLQADRAAREYSSARAKMSKRASALSRRGTQIRPGRSGDARDSGQVIRAWSINGRVWRFCQPGDELADLDERFSEEKIINSNSYGIAAAVQEAGGIPFLLGIAKDTAGRP